MTVRFNDPEEFINELRQAPPNLEPILRLTVRCRLDTQTGVINHLSVMATYLRFLPGPSGPIPSVVALEAYQGEDWGPHFDCSRKTRHCTQELLARLRSVAGELDLECRSGVYESLPNQKER